MYNFNIFLTISEEIKYIGLLAMKLFVMLSICSIIHVETMPSEELTELVYGRVKRIVYRKK